MKRTTKERINGSISIFLVIILVPMIALSGLLVDVSRMQLAKSMVSSNGDLVMNSALANYDTVLKDVYGLFAMSQTEEELSKNLQKYFVDNLIANGIIDNAEDVQKNPLLRDISAGFSGKSSNLMHMDIENFTAAPVAQSNLANSQILKNQIVEFMKYRTPVNGGLSFLNAVAAFSKFSKQLGVTKAKANVDEKAGDFNKACSDLYKKLKEYNLKASGYSEDSWNRNYDSFSDSYKKINENIIIITSKSPETFITKTNGNYPYDVEGILSENVDGMEIGQLQDKRSELLDEIQSTDFNIKYCRSLCNYCENNKLTFEDKIQFMNLYKEYIDKISLFVKCDKKIKKAIPDSDPLYNKLNNKLNDSVKISNKEKEIYESLMQETSNLCNRQNMIINNYIDILSKSIQLIDESKSLIDNVKTAAANVVKANSKLDGSIKEYDEGSNKDLHDGFSDGMKQECEYNKKSFDVKSIDELEKQLDAHRNYICNLKSTFENVKYSNKPIKEIDSFETAKNALLSNKDKNGRTYKQIIEEKKNDDQNSLSSYADEIFPEVYKAGKYPTYNSNSYWKPLEGGFWRYLQNAFSGTKTDSKDKETKEKLTDVATDESKAVNNYTGIKDLDKKIFSDLPSGAPSDDDVADSYLKVDGNTNKGFLAYLTNISQTVSELLSGIEQAMKAGRDNLYVSDYCFNMFSFYTQNAEYGVKNNIPKDKLETTKLKTIKGININDKNNAMYRSEIEYILYGMQKPNANIKSAKARIFAIRFIANSGYALTNAEIKGITLPPALSIQAASCGVIPYKLPQVVMQLSLALAESGMDIKKMEAGQKVAIIKSNDTWVMSPKGASKEIEEYAKQTLNATIDEQANKLTGTLDKLIDSTGEKIQVKTVDLVRDVTIAANAKTTEVVGHIFNMFSDKLVTSLEQVLLKGKDTSKTAVQQADEIINGALNEVDNYIKSKPDGIVKTIMQEYFNKQIKPMAESAKGEIENAITNIDNASASETIRNIQTEVAKKISDVLNGLSKDISDKLKDTITKFSTKIKTTADGYIDMAAEDAVKVTNEFLDTTFNKYSEKLPDIAGNKGKNSSVVTMLKFGYSDYLKMFLFLKLCNNDNDDKTVKRIADVIQINVCNGFSDTNPLYKHAKGSGFRMKNANTYIQIDATVNLKTMFISQPFLKKYSGKSKDHFTIKYKSAVGY